MPIPDYDNTLIGQYIKAIENPTREGLVGDRWYQSTRKGDDVNNRGWGVDVVNNKKAAQLVKDRPKKWLTLQEEKDQRNSHIQESQRILHEYYEPVYLRPYPLEGLREGCL